MAEDGFQRQGYPGGERLKELDTYITTLERRLFMISGSVRRDIVQEVRGHLEDSAKAYGGGSRGMRKAIAEFGPSDALARQYREIYEPGLPMFAGASAVAVLLALLSHPFMGAVSSLLFAVLALFLVFASVHCGKRLGLVSAIAAVATRLLETGYFVHLYADYIDYSAIGMAVFAIATLLLLPIGYFPGSLRERFFKEDMF